MIDTSHKFAINNTIGALFIDIYSFVYPLIELSMHIFSNNEITMKVSVCPSDTQNRGPGVNATFLSIKGPKKFEYQIWNIDQMIGEF